MKGETIRWGPQMLGARLPPPEAEGPAHRQRDPNTPTSF